jgi:hypothetical protein
MFAKLYSVMALMAALVFTSPGQSAAPATCERKV